MEGTVKPYHYIINKISGMGEDDEYSHKEKVVVACFHCTYILGEQRDYEKLD